LFAASFDNPERLGYLILMQAGNQQQEKTMSETELVKDSDQLTAEQWLEAIKADAETIIKAQDAIGKVCEFFGDVYTVARYADQVAACGERIQRYAANLKHVAS
jgi:hypothetical protein